MISAFTELEQAIENDTVNLPETSQKGFSTIDVKSRRTYLQNFCLHHLEGNYAIFKRDEEFTVIFSYHWSFGLQATVQKKSDNTVGLITHNSAMQLLVEFIARYDLPFKDTEKLVIYATSQLGKEISQFIDNALASLAESKK